MLFLWSPKHEKELIEWLAVYFDKPVETFESMSTDRIWEVYRKIRPFDPPIGTWVSAEYH